MDLNKYVPRARAEALVAAAEDRAELAEEGLRITQGEIMDCEARALAAESKVAAAEERAKAAEAKAAKEEMECEAAKVQAAKERDLRGQAEGAEANVRADLKVTHGKLSTCEAKCAEAERDLKASKAEAERTSRAASAAEIRAATAEKLLAALEKRPSKAVPISVPAMSPMGYEIDIRRTSDGTMNKLLLTPKKAH